MALPSTLLVFIFISLIPPSFCCPVDQKQALLPFKSHIFNASNSSADSSLFGLDSWNSTNPDCCTCDRVVCDSSSRAVIALHLDSINPLLFLEPKILSPEELNLDENFFHAKIPEVIGNLTKLQHLSLQQNDFHAEIPSSLLKLNQLQVLDLSNNSLSMVIPPDIGNLSKISTLALSKNDFTGGIPPSIRNMSKLETLKLENNMLTGEIPSWLFTIKKLRNLLL
ncbi:hypothetical protein Vadar_019550 [Vaccinium darrowii]|uniref:Uncharacterized protein n=1 Tax=Vaccinium darrowii TaxID=229202 RepID=A0ACB7XB34_9ERIC|nr:hypothetical protein Vadar_019550 [Vaccinium darrowii]